MEKTVKQKIWESYRFPIILIASIVLGCAIGAVLGEKATVLKPLGEIFLNLMFTIVVPLVFLTISSAVGSMINMKRLGKILGTLLVTFLVTGAIAGVMIITIVKIFPPALGANIAVSADEIVPESVDIGEKIVAMLTVSDFNGLFTKSNMLPLIIFSVLFGLAVSAVGGEDNIVVKGLNALSQVVLKLVNYFMLYAPIGLGAYFAALIGEFGPQLLGSYGRVMAVYYPTCLLYFLVFFALYAFFAAGSAGVKVMFKNILSPAATSLATQSSIATLPVNLDAAARIGIPKDIRDIVLPIGATMHMDGTVISAITKTAFLFGLYGREFAGVGNYAAALAIAVFGGVAMSGIPGGGLISEMMIVNLFGFPAEAFPIIATIGFLVDPPCTCLNAAGDTVAAMIVTRLTEGKDWLKKRIASGEVQL